ncbi:GGDEF domain-containing protein [Sagittula salina]|uniref:diguanylate cyclase n=1 Tax=Sagittula salina TaxID=2820268 RepID=A0A940S1Z8_9RHOB|nr:GGDEF domain-containing protein [Sagittula salina]MBP0481085.1 GGDEF domain-containing protein [Sagittula salina]
MDRTKGYFLVAAVILALTINVLVTHAAVVGMEPLPRGESFLVGVGLSATIIGLFTWTLAYQAQQSAQSAAELRRLVFRDRLTDVSTRDFLFDRVGRDRVVEGIVLMVDIDHFKRVNDSLGHLAGDAALRSVAARLRDRCREEDIVCRFGGEEFLIFLAGSDRARGTRVAEGLRRAVAGAAITWEGRSLDLTISVGAVQKTRSMPFEAAIRSADEALYAAKRLGRNRCVLAWEGAGPQVPQATIARCCPCQAGSGSAQTS